MKKTYLLLALFSILSLAAHSQLVRMDSTFSQDGFQHTSVFPQSTHSRPLAICPNGDILTAGSSIEPYGLRINRYNSFGDSMTSIRIKRFGQAGFGANTVKVLDDGKILFNDGANVLMRYRENGTRDSSFGINGATPLFGIEIRDILTDPNGKIYAVGEYAGHDAAVVIAFEPDGRPDSTFSDDGIFEYADGIFDLFFSIAMQEDGKIVVCGCSYYSQTETVPATLLRITTAGILDSTFGVGGVVKESFEYGGENFGILIQSDQKIVITGYTNFPDQAMVVRYLQNGDRDSTFGTLGIQSIPGLSEGTDMWLKPDGKLLVYGWKEVTNETHATALFQLLPNGNLDPAFGNNGIYFSPHLGMLAPMTMAVIDDHTIIACGTKNYFDSTSYFNYLAIQRFVLDLNVGTIHPEKELNHGDVLIYPNPISHSCTVKFTLEHPEMMDISLFDLNGKLIQTIRNDQSFASGENEVSVLLDAHIPSGQYVISLRSSAKEVLGIQVFIN